VNPNDIKARVSHQDGGKAQGAVMSTTTYSEKIKGARGNYDWHARFDITDGYLGITQIDGESVKDRVLLSPEQVQELLKFVGQKKTSRAA
jgi:hypothetical protein